MGFETAFLEMLPSTLKVSTRSGHDNYGKPTFASSTTSYRCRVVQKAGFVRSPDGETVAVTHVAWVRSTSAVSITVDDRITLPSSFAQGTVPPLIGVESYPDVDGVHNRKLLFGQ